MQHSVQFSVTQASPYEQFVRIRTELCGSRAGGAATTVSGSELGSDSSWRAACLQLQ
jgi:hypothetical protein